MAESSSNRQESKTWGKLTTIRSSPNQTLDGTASFNQYEKPKIDEYLKLSGFNFRDFQFKWSLLIFAWNCYNIFTTLYFIGIAGFPTGVWLLLEIGAETVLIFDIVMRLMLRNSDIWSKNWILHENISIYMLTISSIPISLILLGASSALDLSAWWVGYLRLVKLLRFGQVRTFSNNVSTVSKKFAKLVLQIVELILILFGITHLAAMFWLAIVRYERNNGEDETWYDDWNEEQASQFEEYIDSIFWATATMTSIGYGDIFPVTNIERAMSLIVMICGATMYAGLFGTLEVLIDNIRHHERENIRLLNQTKKWAQLRQIGQENVARILHFYNFVRQKSEHLQTYQALDKLPISLKTDISMSIFDDLIRKVNLFDYAGPEFSMNIVRYLQPKLYMPTDFIVRQDEYAYEMFFIRTGVVEIFAADSDTIVANLDSGCYFGEIGILLQEKRSLSVRAKTTLQVSTISKPNMISVLRNFPEHKEFLMKVATQRMETTYPGDFVIEYDLFESDKINIPAVKTQRTLMTWMKLSWFNNMASSLPLPIDLESRVHFLWVYFILFAWFYNLFYVPYAIAFDYSLYAGFYALDSICILIYALDIFIQLNTTYENESGEREYSVPAIREHYLNNGLFTDLIAAIPFEYIIFTVPNSYLNWVKLLRLLKISRLLKVRKFFMTRSGLRPSTFKLVVFVFIFIYFTHWAACIMFFIGKIQLEDYPHARYDNRTMFSVFGEPAFHDYNPLLDMASIDQYIHTLYWAYATAGTIAYGDLIPVTAAEKIYAFVIMIMAKILAAFVYAEATSAVSDSHEPYNKHILKEKNVKSWMAHLKLPKMLQQRVINHYDILWRDLQGYDDAHIMSELPAALKTDISLQFLDSFTESGNLPFGSAAILMIAQMVKIQKVAYGEIIIQIEEVGLEMYVIIEGEVQILSDVGFELARLGVGDSFGEMALLAEKSNRRCATAIAISDVSLAMLTLEDFLFTMDQYPEFSTKIRRQVWSRWLVTSQHLSFNGKEQCDPKLFTPPSASEPDDESSPTPYAAKPSTPVNEGLKDIDNPIEDYVESTTHYSPAKIVPMLSNIKTTINEGEETSRMNRLDSVTFASNIHYDSIKARADTCRAKIRKFLSEEKFVVVVVVMKFWNLFFMPLQIAFEYKFTGFLLFMEIITILVYTWDLSNLVRSKNSEKGNSCQFKALVAEKFFVLFPFALIFSFQEVEAAPRWIVVTLSLLRLLDWSPIHKMSSDVLKKYMRFLDLLRIIQVIGIYIIINHIIAWLWIEIAKLEDDSEKSWIRRIPVPRPTGTRTAESEDISQDSLYVHALYWSIVTFSHIGVGDITAITVNERAFNCLVVLITYFCYAILFGNMASLVSNLNSHLRTHLYSKYSFALNYLEKKNLGSFKNQVEQYFGYIWKDDVGIDESELLSELPLALQTDIRLNRYYRIVKKSSLFRENGVFSEAVARSIFRMIDIEYYMKGDFVITGEDKNSELFIILDGQINLESSGEILERLRPGDYIGGMETFTNNLQEFPYSAICASICKLGVINKKNVEVLATTFPTWTDSMNEKVKLDTERLHQSDMDLQRHVKEEKSMNSQPEMPSSDELFQLKKDGSKNLIAFYVIHLINLIVLGFEIPVVVGFDISADIAIRVVESVTILEAFIFLWVNIVNFYQQTVGGNRMLLTIKTYFRNGLVYDILACSPLTLALAVVDGPLWLIFPLRIIRIFACIRIRFIFEKLEIYYLELTRYVTVCKTILFLFYLWHWSSCLWFFVNNSIEDSDTFRWMDLHNLESQDGGIRYLYSIYFTMNIVTSVGYGDMYGTTDTERMLTCFIILTGDALFAVAFGMMVNLAATQESELANYIAKTGEVQHFVGKYNISNILMTKLNEFYAFQWAIQNKFGAVDMSELYDYLPHNMVGHLMFASSEKSLKSVTILSLVPDKAIKYLATKLTSEIYLPGDFVIVKGEIGEEMFFIVEGGLHVLSSDSDEFLYRIEKGGYIGELALVSQVKRVCSVQSCTFSLLNLLNRDDFERAINEDSELLRFINRKAKELTTGPKDVPAIQEQTIGFISDMVNNALEARNMPPKRKGIQRNKTRMTTTRRINANYIDHGESPSRQNRNRKRMPKYDEQVSERRHSLQGPSGITGAAHTGIDIPGLGGSRDEGSTFRRAPQTSIGSLSFANTIGTIEEEEPEIQKRSSALIPTAEKKNDLGNVFSRIATLSTTNNQ